MFGKTQKECGMRGAVKALFRPYNQTRVTMDQLRFAIEPGETVGYIGVNSVGTL
ncbi:MAG: hypothetical protein M3R24_07085 [Chloroflexota bacterium]|nr:hypothetical protein [Chloroflexota bacterium]